MTPWDTYVTVFTEEGRRKEEKEGGREGSREGRKKERRKVFINYG